MTEENINNTQVNQNQVQGGQGQPGAASTHQAQYQAGNTVPPVSTPTQAIPYPTMPMPLMQLSGGMKFGWFVMGFLGGIPGMVLAWLINVDKMPAVKNEAVKWSVIGFVVTIVIGILCAVAVGGAILAYIASMADWGTYGGHYDYSSMY